MTVSPRSSFDAPLWWLLLVAPAVSGGLLIWLVSEFVGNRSNSPFTPGSDWTAVALLFAAGLVATAVAIWRLRRWRVGAILASVPLMIVFFLECLLLGVSLDPTFRWS